jgi:23S rRNA pseudouridine955/2504/2580 synthase
MTRPPILVYLVEDSEGMRLDRWLKRQIPDLRQGVLEKLLRLGKIKLNDAKITAGHRISVGDVITVREDLDTYKGESPQSEPRPEPKKSLPLSPAEIDFFAALILWEDEDLLVINKPSGLAVQGGSKTTTHVDRYLAGWGELHSCRYRLTHRLDRDTSGVLVIAKTAEMAAHLAHQFRDGQVEKTYWAITVGQPRPGRGEIKAPLIKAGTGDREKVVVDFKTGKPAITGYQTLKRLEKPRLPYLAWMELTPKTGRTHQLRVHCTHVHAPILGDGKYGGKIAMETDRTLHLHARSIMIRDRDGTRLSFTAPPPDHFAKTLRQYGIEWSKIF